MGEPAAQELIGGRYRLQRKLGEGGMGAVWEATHTVTRRRHALKFLKGVLGQREDLRRRFSREALAASMVRHPNVVGVQDLFELEDGTLVMVMELLEGQTLGARIREACQLSLEEIASYLVKAVSAVGTAHALGIVHRDLKPENIFLAGALDAPDVRVLDFGIAKLTERESTTRSGITRTGALLGTPCYMSPEQAFGDPTTDHRTDIWSLGVIMYEALAGGRPVEGESIGQVLKRLVTDGITPIQVIVPDLPDDVSDLIRRMLQQERDERPQDLGEVMAVLERYTSARAPSFGPPTVKPIEALEVVEDPAADSVVPPGPPKSRRLGSLGIAAAGAVIAASVWWMIRPGRSVEPLSSTTSTVDHLSSSNIVKELPAPETREAAAKAADVDRVANPPEPTPVTTTPSTVKARSGARPRTPRPVTQSEDQRKEKEPVVARPPARAAEDGFVEDPPF